MAVELRNEMGKILMNEELIAEIAGYAAVENYGIVGMGSKKSAEGFLEFMKKDSLKRGIKVSMISVGEVDIDMYVTLTYGVSLSAVADNARDNVRYRVEDLTGVKVRNVNIYIEEIRV